MKRTRSRSTPGNVAAIAALVLVVAAAVLWSSGTDDWIWLPSPAQATNIVVAGHPLPPGHGAFYYTFVEEQRANVLTRLWYSHFDPEATVVSLHTYYGATIPSQAVQQRQNIADMIDSKTNAELAAFNALGHPTPGEQVAVAGISPQSKAIGRLQVNDIILKVDGRDVQIPQQLRQIVQGVKVGVTVSLLVSRTSGGATHLLSLRIPTVSDAGRAVIGITPIVTFSTPPTRLPYQVTINSGDVQGPSAGLMFALSIVDHLSTVDITHGYRIAGTGEIDPDGNVLPIGGVKQKVIGARQAGARYFFVPQQNYAEAQPYAHGLTLVPVYTLEQALAYLNKLH